jgi:hypothetical protein
MAKKQIIIFHDEIDYINYEGRIDHEGKDTNYFEKRLDL